MPPRSPIFKLCSTSGHRIAKGPGRLSLVTIWAPSLPAGILTQCNPDEVWVLGGMTNKDATTTTTLRSKGLQTVLHQWSQGFQAPEVPLFQVGCPHCWQQGSRHGAISMEYGDGATAEVVADLYAGIKERRLATSGRPSRTGTGGSVTPSR